MRHKYLRNLETVADRSSRIVYRSCDGVVVYVNAAFEAVTGMQAHDVVGTPVGAIGHPEDCAVVMPQRDEAVRHGCGRFRHRVRLRTAWAGWVWVDADFSVITNPDTGAVETHAHARKVPEPVAGEGVQAS